MFFLLSSIKISSDVAPGKNQAKAKDETKRLVDGRHWRPSTKRTGRSERAETKRLVDGRLWRPSTKRTRRMNERTIFAWTELGRTNDGTNERTNSKKYLF